MPSVFNNRNVEINGRCFFCYSFHQTMLAANEALERYYSTDEVSDAEWPDVVKVRLRDTTRWAVIIRDDY